MKKLILLLTLTMMFGQTKLETRLYEVDIAEINQNSATEYNLSAITGYSLDYYILQIIEFEADGAWSMICTRDAESIENAACLRLDQNNVPFYSEYDENEQIGYSSTIEVMYNQSTGNLKLAVTAAFPQEDTGYIEDGFDYCVEPGSNLMSYPCDSAVALLDAIPSDALSQFEGIIGAGEAATNLNGNWVGSLTAMQASSGYWIQSNTALCFNYDCSEN